MAIWLSRETRLVVQGITGREGKFHALGCRDYGTQVVAGVTPGKGGESVEGIPVFDSVEQARSATGANASMVFVPPPFAADAICEAAAAGLELVVAITEGIPVADMLRVKAFLRDYPAVRLIGPNCPGIITPGQAKIGIMPGHIHRPGASASSRARARSPTRRSGSSPGSASGSRPASASAAIRSMARASSTSSRRSPATPTPRPW
jgi:succinyl-CoA synthetase alpha subunit